MTIKRFFLPRLAAAVFCLGWLFTANIVAANIASAQQAVPRADVPSIGAAPKMPDYPHLVQNIWSHLVALQQANASGNYQAFHSLGAPGFQKSNPPQRLAKIFANLRAQNVDLNQTLSLTPVFTKPPLVNKSGFLHMQGQFPLRPLQINFELMFQPVNGQWRMFGISVNPTPAPALNTNAAPAQSPTQQPAQNSDSTGSVNKVAFQSPGMAPFDLQSYMPVFLQNTGFNPWVLLAFFAGFLLVILALFRQSILMRRRRKDEQLDEYYDLSSENMFVEPRMPPPV